MKSLGLEPWGTSRDSAYGMIPRGKKKKNQKARKEERGKGTIDVGMFI